MVELDIQLDSLLPQSIDGWVGYAVSEDGKSVLASKIEGHLSMSKVFPAEGEWAVWARRLTAEREWRTLFMKVTDAEWKEFRSSRA